MDSIRDSRVQRRLHSRRVSTGRRNAHYRHIASSGMMARDDCPVLVIEDDASLRDLMDWGLSDLGYRVATAGDGLAALEVIQREPPCLVFLDMRMPVLDAR